MDMLQIHGLCKRFGEKQVLKDLSLCVPEHSIFGFIGKNGAGKTTTMKAVLGLLAPDAGEILVGGELVRYGETPTNRMIGYLPDVPEFYSFMNAREYLSYCGEIAGMERGVIRSRTEELLALVGLAGEGHRIRGYSRGMKQRLGIASALLARPRLLICDEPTSALDPIGRREILDILLSLREQTTVLFSTHILSDVERIATDVALLDGGAVQMQGKLSELKKKYPSDAYRVEMDGDAASLLAHFPAIRRDENGQLLFHESEYALAEVLHFVAEHRLPLVRIERTQHTLEDLFVEVTEK